MSEIGERLNPSAVAGGVLDIAKRVAGRTAPGRYVTGSDSPAYVHLDWSKQPELNPDEIDWCEIDADPEAGRMPRFWPNAAVLAADQSIYEEIDADYLRTPGHVKDAIAWISEGIVRVGVNPNADNLFGGANIDGESMLTIAKRRSSDAVKATIGLWVPSEKELIVHHASLVTPSLPIDELVGAQYRHTSLVG